MTGAGVLLSPFVLGYVTTVDGSFDTVPFVVSSTTSVILVVSGVLLFAQRRVLLMWFITLSIAPTFFVLLEAALWFEFQWAQRRHQVDLRAQEIMRNAPGQGQGGLRLGRIALLPTYRSDLYNVNTSGFRTREFTAKRPGEFRVALLGGSTAFGQLLADQHTIANILERQLQERFGGKVTVWNLGIPGTAADEELAILTNIYEVLRPDLVVVYHGGNDFGPAYNAIAERQNAPLVLEDTIKNRIYAALDKFGTTSLIRLFLSALFAPAGPELKDPAVRQRIDEAVSVYDATMRRFQAFCIERDITCRYFLQPLLTTREPRTFFERQIVAERRWRFPRYGAVYEAFLAKILKRSSVPHVDISDVLDGQEHQQFFDYIHTTSSANTIIAVEIFETLLEDPAVRSL